MMSDVGALSSSHHTLPHRFEKIDEYFSKEIYANECWFVIQIPPRHTSPSVDNFLQLLPYRQMSRCSTALFFPLFAKEERRTRPASTRATKTRKTRFFSSTARVASLLKSRALKYRKLSLWRRRNTLNISTRIINIHQFKDSVFSYNSHIAYTLTICIWKASNYCHPLRLCFCGFHWLLKLRALAKQHSVSAIILSRWTESSMMTTTKRN